MTATRAVVAFPFHDWRKSQLEGIRTRDGHLLRELAKNPAIGPLLIIDRPVSRAERLTRRQPVPIRGTPIGSRTGDGWRGWLTSPEPGIVVLDVAVNDVWNVVRLGRGWWFEVFRQPRIYEAVEWAIDTVIGNSSRDFACLAWTPTAAPILEALQPARLVFDSLDNWLIHPVLRRHERQARAAYSAIFARADVILASGAASAAAFAPFGVPISIVANGVDIDRFGAALERPADMPPGLIVGYAGKLAGRIDVDFCRAVAGLLPDVQFVFLGPVMDLHVRTLAKIPNVHLLGDRRPEVLPAYLESFDIGWIPHRVGEGETGGDPIKLYEYWAAGRQVVTTAIDGSDGWRDRAFVVADAAEAASSIRLILSGDAMKEVWVDPDRLWSTIAERLAAALVSENESFAPSATGVPNAGDLRFNAPPSSPAPS